MLTARRRSALAIPSRKRRIVSARGKWNPIWVRYALAVCIYAIIFGVWQADPMPLHVHAAGVLVAAICMFPMALWHVRGSKGVPMFEVICIAYLLQFANPVYLQPNAFVVFSRPQPFTWDETFQTLLLVALGISSMIVAYYASQRSRFRHRLPQVDLPLTLAGRQRYIVAAIVFGLTTSILQTLTVTLSNSGQLDALVRLLSSQFTVAIVLLAYPYYRKEVKSVGWVYLLYGSVIISVALGLAGGSLEPALSPLVILLLIRWQVTRRFPLRWLVFAFVGFILLQSVKVEYRQQTASGGVSGTARVTLWFQDAQQTLQPLLTGDVLTNIQTLTRQSMSRFDTFHVFEHVHQWTPTVVPYYGGSSYSYFLVTWVPRAVWPDKPNAGDVNVRFELDYGLLTPSQAGGASIGLGQITEAYANFGVLGVAIIMAMQGVIFALLDGVFNGPESEGGRAIYLAIMVSLLNGIGASTPIIFGALIQNSLGSAFIVRLFSTSWRAGGPEPGRRGRGYPRRTPLPRHDESPPRRMAGRHN
jgi:O-antigen polysaccharide polymerase Wzy